MAASGLRYSFAWLENLLDDRQLLLNCPPATADVTRDHLDALILVRHKSAPQAYA